MILSEKSIMTDFDQLLEKELSLCHKPTYYCLRMRLSRYKLNKLTRAHYGVSVDVLIDTRLLQRAMGLLEQTEERIGVIAYQIGFQDHPYFNRWFKKKTGMPPSRFRKEIRQHPGMLHYSSKQAAAEISPLSVEEIN